MQNAAQIPSDLQDAIRRYEQYVRVDPSNVLLQAALGDYYHQASQFDAALACYRRCLELQPNDVRARSRTAMVLISQHRFVEAERCILDLINAGESDAALWHNLGIAQFYQQHWEDAVRSFSTAAERGLTHAANFNYLARALHHLGRTEEGVAAARRCVELAATPDNHGYLALLEMENGDMASAFASAQAVLAQDPHNPDANVVAGTEAVEKQASADARRYFETAIAKEKDNGRAWLGLGLAHLYDQKTTQAIDALQTAMHIFPKNSGIIVTLGWAHIVAGDPSAAQRVFEHAINIDRNFSESHAGLAAALALQNQLDRAKEAINLAKRLDPRSFGVGVASTFLLAAHGNQQAAAKIFGKFLEQSPRQGVPQLIDQLRIYLAKHPPRTKPAGQKSSLH